MRPGTKRNDITGLKFGRLTVLNFDCYKKAKETSKTSRPYYICKCECGNIVSKNGHLLQSGGTKSCGCLAKEQSVKQGKINGLRLGSSNSGFTCLYYTYKHGAKSRNYSFNLTKEEFKTITSNNCHYCNKIPSQVKNKQAKKSPFSKDYIYNGIDRKDNNIGYELSNCLPCCKTCNIMKTDMKYEDFIEHISKIYNYVKK